MSRRSLRFILALALALAVPLQAFAAAAGGICMAAGHHEGASSHAHDDGDTHHDHSPPADSAAHCAPCAACCASAAISPSALVMQPDERADVLNAIGPPLAAGIPGSTVDRPPLPL